MKSIQQLTAIVNHIRQEHCGGSLYTSGGLDPEANLRKAISLIPEHSKELQDILESALRHAYTNDLCQNVERFMASAEEE